MRAMQSPAGIGQQIQRLQVFDGSRIEDEPFQNPAFALINGRTAFSPCGPPQTNAMSNAFTAFFNFSQAWR